MTSLRTRAALFCLIGALTSRANAGTNLLVNPHFDGTITPWEVRDAPNAYSPIDANGSATSGSGITPEGEAIHQCVAITGGRVYDFAGSVYMAPGLPFAGPAGIGITFGTTCTTSVASPPSVSTSVVGSWVRLEGRGYAPPQARFATFSMSVSKVSTGDILKGQLDDAYLALTEAACPTLWTFPILATTPGSRFGVAMAYDAARARTVLFGGNTGTTVKGDTWTWDGAAWLARTGAAPEPRAGAAAVYDSARARVLLFGGSRTVGGQVELLPGTWEWNGDAWTQRALAGPPGRSSHAMAYDAVRDRVVLFGGDADHHPLDDTWEWDGNVWREIVVTGPKPSPRFGHAMAYDARRGRVVLFGGALDAGASDETWEWDGARWALLELTTKPTARYGTALAFDSSRGEVVLFGGAVASNVYATPDVWRLDAQGWQMEERPGSFVRSHHALTYDSARRRLVVYGGITTGSQVIGLTAERLAPTPLESLVPIVLDVFSGTAHFTTEVAITNRGASPVDIAFRYTASLGALLGSGTVAGRVEPGAQLVIPDVLAFLRSKGLAIPDGTAGQQGGTLLLSFGCVGSRDDVAVTARTTTATRAPQPVGSAGLAYAGLDPSEAASSRLVVYGLRANATDRSNIAVYNASAEPLTLKITAASGAGDGAQATLDPALGLGPYEWRQFSFGSTGLANGIVTVERIAGAGTFGAYGVVNDNATNDGSFVLPVPAGASSSASLFVPVLVETGAFVSELVLSSSAAVPVTLDLELIEALSGIPGPPSHVPIVLAPGEQRILADAIDFLRQRGAPIGPRGARSYAGALRVTVSGASAGQVYAGARTASQSPGGGQFGLFTAPVSPDAASSGSAVIYGLRADESNRSNVAVVHAGSAESGAIELTLQAYDGDAGGVTKGTPTVKSLTPGQWAQIDGFLAGAGVRNGWVVVRRTAGTAPWLAYGVVNDGGQPGQRTGDGAYVPMVRSNP